MIFFIIRDYYFGGVSELVLDESEHLHAGNIIKYSPEHSEIEIGQDECLWYSNSYEDIIYSIEHLYKICSFAVYEYEVSDTEFREVFFDEKEIPPTRTKFFMKLGKDLDDITDKINKLRNFK